MSSERQYDVSFLRVNANGSFVLSGKAVSATMHTLFNEGQFSVSAKRGREGQSQNAISMDLGEADDDIAELIEPFLRALGNMLVSVDVEVELSPRGAVIAHRTLQDPFAKLSRSPNADLFMADLFPWLGSQDDHSSWIATLLLLEYPKDALARGDSWELRRDMLALGVRVQGVAKATLDDYEGSPGQQIARIVESGSFDLDASFLETRLKNVGRNTKIESLGKVDVESTWTIDVQTGQIQATSGEMKGLGMRILGPGRKAPRTTETRTHHLYKTTWSEIPP